MTMQNKYQVWGWNGKLVKVATFPHDQFKQALEAAEEEQILVDKYFPGTNFRAFVSDMTDGHTIVAEAGKGDLDKWNVTNGSKNGW